MLARSIVLGAFVGLACAAMAKAGEPALTLYNQNFGVVRDTVPLDLRKGVNEVRFTDTTAHLEPDSVILRDPTGKVKIQILEQNYRADPVTQELLLSLYEGKTIQFRVQHADKIEIITGKIVRAGYVPHSSLAFQRYGSQYYNSQMAMAYPGGGSGQPIIEVDGQLQFQLPGLPLFPALTDDTILKPMIQWVLNADGNGKLDAELCYVTGGMTWQADYNIVAPEKGDALDIVGWVTMDNQSGKTFENAKIKLMAGDVSKIQQEQPLARARMMADVGGGESPSVTEKAFEEYHLYTLERRTTLHDRETKQVEFVRAANVKSRTLYIYDGAKMDGQRYGGQNIEYLRAQREYGTQCNPKVWVMREFENKEENGLGIPLPKGRMRFYRQDSDGQLEFTGENVIDHTPKDEKVRVYTGNAFDLVGERRQTEFRVDNMRTAADEAFEIKLRNHKKEAVEIRVVEHLYRGLNWEIVKMSQDFQKTDSRTIEFTVTLEPDKEAVVTYAVHYTW